MIIGNSYLDNKLYRGVRYYDRMPLTSRDLHENSDLLYSKNALVLNNTLGSGILNEPGISIATEGVSLRAPLAILLDGDVVLVQSDSHILSTSDIIDSGISDGLLCVVGWYQHLTASSTLRSYGGVRNTIIYNDLIDDRLQMQVSTRYQLRWDTVILDRQSFNNNEIVFLNIDKRDATGELLVGDRQLAIIKDAPNFKVAAKPTDMEYAVSDLYIVPIIEYVYEESNFSKVSVRESLMSQNSGNNMIKSTVEPSEDVKEGDIWFDPTSYRFKFYVEEVGFVPSASDITMIQYRNTVSMTSQVHTPTDMTFSIGIDSYTEDDVLQVIYEGLVMTEEIHYRINKSDSTVTLLQATSEIGDKLTFVVTKLVDSSNISSISTEFSSHINSIGTASTVGHIKLSDNADNSLGSSSGIAVTPKALYDATTLIDTSTGKKYRLVVTNGILSVAEIV